MTVQNGDYISVKLSADDCALIVNGLYHLPPQMFDSPEVTSLMHKISNAIEDQVIIPNRPV